jgi:DNA helicase IV
MKILPQCNATAEQLPIISYTKPGIEVIRGAAGSGKTTTALLRLESLALTSISRFKRLNLNRPVNVLVLTYNRTLAGYIENLASSQVKTFGNDVNCTIETFSAWAHKELGRPNIINDIKRKEILWKYGQSIGLPKDFFINEVEYICGRFTPNTRHSYIEAERTGRGASPQVPRTIRPLILEAIEKYYCEISQLNAGNTLDWHLLTDKMLYIDKLNYDVIIVDEAQDFSANQLRVINHHISNDYNFLTFVTDTAQRLYPRGFTWIETGLDMQTARHHRLKDNHRNTVQIAKFAAGIIEGMRFDEDGTLPDFTTASTHGPLPTICKGKYSKQLQFAMAYLKSIDLTKETVGFLKPQGGHWFDEIRYALSNNRFSFIEITRDRDWSDGPENIAISTMHSAKGLEFDHVIILGLNNENTRHSGNRADEDFLVLRRLLAMAIGRARKSITIGYKPENASDLITLFKAGTYKEVNV